MNVIREGERSERRDEIAKEPRCDCGDDACQGASGRLMSDRTTQLIEDAQTAIRIHEGVLALKAERDALGHALGQIVSLIDNAGLHNLTNEVHLGPTSWYVKMSDAMAAAKELLPPNYPAPAKFQTAGDREAGLVAALDPENVELHPTQSGACDNLTQATELLHRGCLG